MCRFLSAVFYLSFLILLTWLLIDKNLLPVPSNSTLPFPFLTSTIQVASLPSGPPVTYGTIKHNTVKHQIHPTHKRGITKLLG